MQNTQEKTETSAFQLRGSLFTLTVLQLIHPDIDSFRAQLEDLIQQAPKFFEHAPIIIDLQTLADKKAFIDFQAFRVALKDQGLIPVGIKGGNAAQKKSAIAANLAVLPKSKSETEEDKKQNKKEKDDQDRQNKSKIITRPVRSGQQVYARECDLIILAPVSQGAEVLADGNIHVYGPLRGRALAGITGDTDARIICQRMEAELVSIAGRYTVNVSLSPEAQKQVTQIYLDEGKLQIKPLN